jgi:integrase
MTKNITTSISRRSRANGEGSVYPVKNRNCWGASIKNLLEVRITKTFQTKDEAHAWLLEQKKMRSQGLYSNDENLKQTVAEYLLEWVEHNRNQKKPATTRNYSERIRNQINPRIGYLKATALSPRAIEDLISQLISAGYAPGTIYATYRTLSAAYSDGVRLGLLSQNPTTRVKLPKLTSTPMKQISRQDAAKIYSCAMQTPSMHARVELGMVCGLRPGEVLGLLWSDIAWDERTLTISRQVQRIAGKGLVFQSVKQGKQRTIVLTDEQISILRSHKEMQDVYRPTFSVDEGLIFPNSIGSKLDDKRDSYLWKKLLRLAQVKSYQRYQMRKTAFSNLYSELGDVRKLLDYSGHSQVSTVMKSYVFATEEASNEIRRSIDASRPQPIKAINLETQGKESNDGTGQHN